jgi:hypothetical protein
MGVERHLSCWGYAIVPTMAAGAVSLYVGDLRALALVGAAGVGYAGMTSVIYATEHVLERFFGSIDEGVKERVSITGRGKRDGETVADPSLIDGSEF